MSSFCCPRWVLPALAAGLVQLVLMTAYAARFGGDVSAFVCAGTDFAGAWPFERVGVALSKGGFDGQYYYVIARSPWDRQDERFIIAPWLRHVRVFYPAAAWALSGFGDPGLLLWAMPAINLLAVAGIAGLGAAFAAGVGRSPWWGVLAPFLLGAAHPALRNLTDPTATAAALGLLASWLLRWNRWALFGFAAAAVFAREQNVGVVGLVLLAAVAVRDWGRACGLLAVLAAWVGWVAYVWTMYGESPFLAGNFGPPLGGVLARLRHLSGDATSGGAPIHAGGLAYLGAMVAVACVMPLYRAHPVLALTALAGAVTAVCASSWIYMDGHSYTRVFALLPLGIFLWALQSGRRWPLVALAPALLWPAYAVFQVWAR